jgi:hypothetical protein
LLTGCYRKDEAVNPEIYAAALTSVLCMFSPEVVRFVTDPRTGIPGREKWLPSIAEVRAACEQKAALIADVQRRVRGPAMEAIAAPVDENDRRASVARLKEMYPQHFLRAAGRPVQGEGPTLESKAASGPVRLSAAALASVGLAAEGMSASVDIAAHGLPDGPTVDTDFQESEMF